MDVVGAVASAISILEASGKIVQALSRFFSDFAKANATLTRLTDAMKRELELLKELRDLCGILKQEASPRSVECLKDLEKLFQKDPDQNHTLYEDVKRVADWLANKIKKNGSSSRRNQNPGHCGMSFWQKLGWCLKGKRKVESLISRLSEHQRRVDSTFVKVQM